MPIIVEAFYLVTPVSVINQRLTGGLEQFKKLVPNRTYVCDGELAGCGFMNSNDAWRFADTLMSHGFITSPDDPMVEIALVDMINGKLFPCGFCDFLRMFHRKDSPLTLAVVKLKGGVEEKVVAYAGWNPENNMNLDWQTNKSPKMEDLEYVSEKNGVITYRHKVTGQLFYSGHTK
jgi:hypothetical protein